MMMTMKTGLTTKVSDEPRVSKNTQRHHQRDHAYSRENEERQKSKKGKSLNLTPLTSDGNCQRQ
jgi:hypothetical protein